MARTKKTKFNTEEVKRTASGRWRQILSSLASLSEEQLEPKHQPCVKCGGTDRYRAFDDVNETGGLICNQCGKFADGFASLQWLLGIKFGEAIAKVAEHLGIKPAAELDPAKDLAWQPWSAALAKFFCAAKPGVTEESLLAAGCRMAKYKRIYTVIAWPIIGAELDVEHPVGFVIMNYNASDLPKWDRNGNVTGYVNKKLTAGSKPGLVGIHAIERLKTPGLAELVWKSEGLTDQAALWASIPEPLRDRHLVITNANGASELPKWPAGLLAAHNTNLLHDCDEPGQVGARQWAAAIAAQTTSDVITRNVVLPYAMEPKHGKDIRDWLNAGGRYTDLLALADGAEKISVARDAGGQVDLAKVEYPLQQRILKLLQIEVLYEEEGGQIRVFSTFLRKSSSIRQIDRLKKETLIQICGPPAMQHVSSDPDSTETFSISDVREAIALAAASRRGKDDERGIGVWQGVDDYGNETSTVVLVGDTEAARFNGDRVLRRIIAPRADGLVLDFGAGSNDWYEFDLLERNLKNADDHDWCKNVIEQAFALFAKWRWKNDEIDPTVLTGLVLATWVQTVWAWRPLVSIVGESNSGKSFLFEALGGSDHRLGLFGKLAFKQGKSTEAGIRQGINNTARVILTDEFERSKERDKILEMLRASTRGDAIARGTSGQKGKMYRMRHIGWVAATESGLQRQPDMNRFIEIVLKRPERADHGKLALPDGLELYHLGQKLLAIAVAHAIQAKELAIRLKSTSLPAVDARMVECYAVPAAILGVATGYTDTECRGLLADLCEGIEKGEQGRSDHDELLDAVLGAGINCGGKDGTLSVAHILVSGTAASYDHGIKLEAAGVRITNDGFLFISHRQVGRTLLRGSDWERQRLDQILLRVSGAKRDVQRIAGRSIRGISVPYAQEEEPQATGEF